MQKQSINSKKIHLSFLYSSLKPKIVNDKHTKLLFKIMPELQSTLIGNIIALLFISLPVSAQVIPDKTLGGESSTIKSIDELRSRIEGGAIRGENLFHSFEEFNIREGLEVYFANPKKLVIFSLALREIIYRKYSVHWESKVQLIYF